MESNNKAILDHFQESLTMNYQQYCELHGQPPSTQNLITYMITHNIINPTTIRRYSILKKFKQMDGKKTEVVKNISSRFNISQRSIYSILKDHKGKYGIGGEY